MDIVQILQQELGIKKGQVENTIKLIDEGNTIPFIARYRKELTGGLNDEVLRQFGERYTYLQNLMARKEQVIKSIEEENLYSSRRRCNQSCIPNGIMYDF